MTDRAQSRKLPPCSACTALVLVLLICAPAVRAGEASEDEELELELFFAPAETVETAARRLQPIELSPSAVTVVTREDIEGSGARSLPELLRLVPSMDVIMVKPIWYLVGLRGNTSVMSSTMLLLVDGRDTTLEMLGFPTWTVQPFSVDEIERVEVIRGPGSALYGSNAYAGVVNVITRKPGDGPRLTFSLRGGEHGSTELALRGSQKIGEHAFAVSAGLIRQDFWTLRASAIELIHGRVTGDIRLGADASLEVDTGIYHTTGTLFSYISEAYVDPLTNIYGKARFKYKNLTVQAVYDHFDTGVSFNMEVHHRDLEVARIPKVEGQSRKASLLAQHSLEGFHNRLSYGAEYVYNNHHAEVMIEPTQDEHRFGFFAQDELDLGSLIGDWFETGTVPLFVTLGLRFDTNTLSAPENAWELSPRAAVVVVPGENHTLRLGYAHAFLKPTFFETSFHVIAESNLGLESFDLRAPDLKNQTIDSIELGYAADFLENRLTLKIDLAYNWYRNRIFFEYDPSKLEYDQIGLASIPRLGGPGFRFTNDTDGQHGHNVEVQLTGHPTENLRLLAQAGYRQLFNSRSRAFVRTEPVWRIGLGLDLRSLQEWTMSIRAFYRDAHKSEMVDPKHLLSPLIVQDLPAAWILNARLARRVPLGSGEFTAGLEVFNLLDVRARELAGQIVPHDRDLGGERLSRRVTLFLRGTI